MAFSTQKSAGMSKEAMAHAIAVARGEAQADLHLRGGQVLDVFSGRWTTGDVAIARGMIVGIGEDYSDARASESIDVTGEFIVPGFIDAHVHIESSMITPVRFQEAVLPAGTTTAIWDPHEIANVKGVAGIEWALESSEGLLLDVLIMVPSCVPSTNPELGLESSGAVLRASDLAHLVGHPRVLGLAEMMNYPGLLHGDDEVLAKLHLFRGAPRDGHCPGLTGRDLNAYGTAGILSCHESTTLQEAREKLSKGIHVWVREGSCAKDAHKLMPILDAMTSAVLGFCSDDRNPLDIHDEGHISFIVDTALQLGHAPEEVFRAASFGPARAYGLGDRGVIAPGYLADIVVCRPKGRDFNGGLSISRVYKRGIAVAETYLRQKSDERRDKDKKAFAGPNLHVAPISEENLKIPAGTTPGGSGVHAAEATARVIGVREGQIITDALALAVPVGDGLFLGDVPQDVLKIAVVERHRGTGRVGLGFVQGFGIKQGAIATSVNHDSHNIICVGSDDKSMLAAIARLREIDGGIVVATRRDRPGGVSFDELAFPIGGLMTCEPPEVVVVALRRLKAAAAAIGCELAEPFLQLSFLALPVIPNLKVTDRGLVDVNQFRIVPVSVASEGDGS